MSGTVVGQRVTGVQLARSIAPLGWRMALGASALVALLALLGRTPRLGHWLHASIEQGSPSVPGTLTIGLGLGLALLRASQVLGELLLRRAGSRRARASVVFARTVVDAATAHERLLRAIDGLGCFGYRPPGDGPSADALPALASVRLQRGGSFLYEDSIRLPQEIALRLERGGLRVEHRWRREWRQRDIGEEAYRFWLVRQLAEGGSLRNSEPARLLSLEFFSLPAVLVVPACAIAVLPIETPPAVVWPVALFALGLVLYLPLVVIAGVLTGRGPERLFASGLALAVLALALTCAAPSAWELGSVPADAPIGALVSRARSARRDAEPLLGARHPPLPLTRFELRAAQARAHFERRIVAHGSDAVAPLLELIVRDTDPGGKGREAPRSNLEQSWAASVLARIGEPGRPALLVALRDERIAIRSAASHVLGGLPADPQTTARLGSRDRLPSGTAFRRHE